LWSGGSGPNAPAYASKPAIAVLPFRRVAVRRAAVFAALGRVEEAKAAVADTLRRFPDLTIQTYVGTPDWSDAERQRLVETMRKAGFPACAKPEAVAKTINVSLPECPQPTAANEHPIPPWSALDLERYGATNRP
jgi:hypothetical protein